MKVDIPPFRAVETGGTQGHGSPCFELFSLLETCSFMKGMSQKSVRLRASLLPTIMWSVIKKLVNLITYVFFSSLWPPSSLRDGSADLL